MRSLPYQKTGPRFLSLCFSALLSSFLLQGHRISYSSSPLSLPSHKTPCILTVALFLPRSTLFSLASWTKPHPWLNSAWCTSATHRGHPNREKMGPCSHAGDWCFHPQCSSPHLCGLARREGELGVHLGALAEKLPADSCPPPHRQLQAPAWVSHNPKAWVRFTHVTREGLGNDNLRTMLSCHPSTDRCWMPHPKGMVHKSGQLCRAAEEAHKSRGPGEHSPW